MKGTLSKIRLVRRFIRSGNWLEKAMLVAGMTGLLLGIYLSVRPSPALATVWWLPHFISRWADHHGILRNFPAYAMLAVPFLMVATGVRQRAYAVAFLAIFAALMEIIQLWIPTRFADMRDIVWSWAGLLAAWGLFEAVVKSKPSASALNGAEN
jgi:hypothetical protein